MMLSDVSRDIPSLLACASSILSKGVLVEHGQVIDRVQACNAQLVVLVVQLAVPQDFRVDPKSLLPMFS